MKSVYLFYTTLCNTHCYQQSISLFSHAKTWQIMHKIHTPSLIIHTHTHTHIHTNMHTARALSSVVGPWYRSTLLHFHWSSIKVTPLPFKQPCWLWITIFHELDNRRITKPNKKHVYFMGETAHMVWTTGNPICKNYFVKQHPTPAVCFWAIFTYTHRYIYISCIYIILVFLHSWLHVCYHDVHFTQIMFILV